MTKEERREYYENLKQLCESLKDKTDNNSNCMKAYAVAVMTSLLVEGI